MRELVVDFVTYGAVVGAVVGTSCLTCPATPRALTTQDDACEAAYEGGGRLMFSVGRAASTRLSVGDTRTTPHKCNRRPHLASLVNYNVVYTRCGHGRSDYFELVSRFNQQLYRRGRFDDQFSIKVNSRTYRLPCLAEEHTPLSPGMTW